ncbi:hypothetical protein DSM104299_01619 [Baekduia alba]|uniref:hypothetical protein n=1 Tax=Baekduia alba TaxID=2997333 RepID=UPI002341D713|nr:hypothetical protein [Baekduia alba]WCB92919.1 hypothetical protein DSM104299_01619 [Baekduia alba]
MSAVVLARLRDLFVAPTADLPATQVAERAVPSTLAVLAAGADGAVAGSALALAAAAALRARCAVVCVWSGATTPPRPGLASAATRRTADRLGARGLVVAARGRLVTVALPAADGEARAAAERALAAAGDAPVVIVIAGARPPALDPLLAAVDRIVIVPPPDAPSGLEALAVDAAAHLGRSTAILRLPRTGTTANHLLAGTGLVLGPSLRAAATSALEGGHG